MTRITKGAQLLAAQLKPSLSRGELCGKLGVSKQTISGWLSGEFRPSRETAGKLEDMLGIPVRTWAEESDGQAPPDEEPTP